MRNRFSSVRARITAVVAATFALMLAGSSMLMVGIIENEVHFHVNADNHKVLERLRREIRAGVEPGDLDLPVGADGTQFSVEDSRGRRLASSLGITSAVVLIEPPTDLDAADIPAIKDRLGLSSSDRLPERLSLEDLPAELEWELGEKLDEEVEERVEALTDPDNWSRTKLMVSTSKGDYVLVASTPFDTIHRDITILTAAMWLGLAVLVALNAIVAWVVTGSALRPVSRIVEHVRCITDRTLGERVPEPKSGDEIETLAKTMNGMLVRLEAGVRSQRQFVSDASHELRSPITAIITEAEVALGHPGAGDFKVAVQVALAESKRLERLVGDLLTIASADENHRETHHVLDLDDLLLEEAQRINRIPVRTVKVSAARVKGNTDQLSRLVENLLSNAARHARSVIDLALSSVDGKAVLTVDDDGLGVAKADRERVFERFTRLEESRCRDAGGTGLGLALVRAVTYAHGGEVSLIDGPLTGARFRVILPLATDEQLRRKYVRSLSRRRARVRPVNSTGGLTCSNKNGQLAERCSHLAVSLNRI
ncbi:MAG: ATP-binding protein [Thiohalocapsa sp.]